MSRFAAVLTGITAVCGLCALTATAEMWNSKPAELTTPKVQAKTFAVRRIASDTVDSEQRAGRAEEKFQARGLDRYIVQAD